MNSNRPLQFLKAEIKLRKLIEQNAPANKILAQSQKVDNYIVERMKIINKKYKEVS